MDCNRSNELMNLAMDDMLSLDELHEFEHHLAGCENCQADYDLYKSIQNELLLMSDDEVDLPDGFHESLMNRVNNEHITGEKKQKQVPLWKKVNRRYMNVAAALVFVVVFALIGVNNLDDYRSASDQSTVEESATMEAPAMEKSASKDKSESKEEAAMEPAMEEFEIASESTVEDMDAATTDDGKEDRVATDDEASSPEPRVESDVVKLDVSDESVAVTFSEELNEESKEAETDVQEIEILSEAEGEDATVETAGGSQLARDDNAPEKSPKSLDYDGDQQRYGSTDSAPWAWLYIIGSFIGIMIIGGFLILKKMR